MLLCLYLKVTGIAASWQGESCMKRHFSTIVFIIIFITGLSLLLYPTVSDWYNSLFQIEVIESYAQDVGKLDDETYNRLLSEARNYNEVISTKEQNYILSDREQKEYNSLLDISNSGIMGYIEIPVINVKLAIYHGTSEAVLSSGVGHIPGSSLPVGGESTHCVVSGHRGLPSAKLFSNLDELVIGDIFTLYTLEEMLTYEVDKIQIVLPEETDGLAVKKGKDYCTLVTCTPYGINTHRLLVRGHRVEKNQEIVVADAVKMDKISVLIMIGTLPVLVIVIIIINGKKGERQ